MRSVITLCWLAAATAGWWLTVAEARHMLEKREALDDVIAKSPLYEPEKGELAKPDSKVDVSDNLDEHKEIEIEALDHKNDKYLTGNEKFDAGKDVIEDKQKPGLLIEKEGDKVVGREIDGERQSKEDDHVLESGESSEEVLALVAVILVEPVGGGGHGRRGRVRDLAPPVKQLL